MCWYLPALVEATSHGNPRLLSTLLQLVTRDVIRGGACAVAVKLYMYGQ